MTPDELTDLLRKALPLLGRAADELATLDGAAGDGDLGITVSEGARAVEQALDTLPADVALAALLRAVGAAFARGNPSTFAALFGGGLLAAARAVTDAPEVDREAAVAVGRAVAAAIAQRGGAAPGDRTVLDALIPSLDALEQATGTRDAALDAMIQAAESGVAATRQMSPRKGRAAWTGDRGLGHPDAGATAYLRFLQSLREVMVGTDGRADG